MIGPTDPREMSLWDKLYEFEIDDLESQLTFTARLARDNRWSRAFAERAVSEYKKFVFLSLAAGHPITPSVEIDQVWHLHLTYTRSYWQGLCRDILGQPLHHNPTQGGKDEGAKFDDWYRKTLDSYERFFGPPPRDLWPPPEERFGKESLVYQVSPRTHWLIRKPQATRSAVWLAGPLLAGLVLLGCADFERQILEGDFMIWIGLAIVAIVLLKILGRGRGSGHGCSGFGCSSCSGGGCSSSGCGGGGCGS